MEKDMVFFIYFFYSKHNLIKSMQYSLKRGMRDIEAMKMNLNALKNGEALGLFPEGTRKGLEKGLN